MDHSKNNLIVNNQKKGGVPALLKNWKLLDICLMAFDFFAMGSAYFAALWLRFDCYVGAIPRNYLVAWIQFLPVYAVIGICIFWCLNLYRIMWEFASYVELEKIALGAVMTALIHAVCITFKHEMMPASYYIIGSILQFLLIGSSRFAYRFHLLSRNGKSRSIHNGTASRVMLIGAGSAGQLLLRDLHLNNRHNDCVCCIIDDDKNKWGRQIDGVPIVGGRDEILLNAQKYKIEKIYFAIPSATVEQSRDILDICNETGCILKNLPSSFRDADAEVTAGAMKDVAVEDLLGRAPVKVNTCEIAESLKGKVVLVTGGGGSIGSELCRQIASMDPKQLIVFDIYENNAHAIGLELKDKYPELNLEILIGSVRDNRRINQVFAKYHPDMVYHAAAHKHVPLMEASPCETIKNNALGTYQTAYAAMVHGCQRFVLISTDKAVNPTNIMGASKRLCEMIVQSFDRKIREGKAHELAPLNLFAGDDSCSMMEVPESPKTEYVAVRFGNVLGSNGSVIPRFKEQIARGGPVTVTHPDIIRYFMTIPEAASLVLQAGTYAAGGEIFVLDMGSPVKIDTLARNLIRLSGLQPDVDIKISYTGLRPGEKLYEEKLMSEEGLRTTPNKLIHIGSPIPFDVNTFLGQLQMLLYIALDGRDEDIRDMVATVVPTYHPAGINGCEVKGEVFENQMKQIDRKESDSDDSQYTVWHWGNWKTPVQRPVWLHKQIH